MKGVANRLLLIIKVLTLAVIASIGSVLMLFFGAIWIVTGNDEIIARGFDNFQKLCERWLD